MHGPTPLVAAPFPARGAAGPAADGHRRPGTEMHLRPCGLLTSWSTGLGCSMSGAVCTWLGGPHTRPCLPITRLRARRDVWMVHWAAAYPAPPAWTPRPQRGVRVPHGHRAACVTTSRPQRGSRLTLGDGARLGTVGEANGRARGPMAMPVA